MQKKLIHPVQINNIEIPNNLWLAPMAGYTNKALRIFSKKFGAGYAVTEMVSLEGLVRKDRKTLEYLDIENEDFTTVQLFGKNEPKKFYQAAKFLQDRINAKIIDVNFGCPVRKVIRSEAGSYLLKTPRAMSDIIKAIKNSGAIASAKIRSGFDKVNLEDTMEALNQAGADIITLHPRLAIEFYNGHSDWEQIRRAREMTNAILIASGDIKSPEDAKKMLELTHADGIMIGRQAIGSTYIFQQVHDYLTDGAYHSYTLQEIKAIILEYARLFIDLTKEDYIVPIRSTLIQYVKNFKNSKEIRHRLSLIHNLRELEGILEDW